ncbi:MULTISPECIES: hypothetical protein [unclassified Endozoicomonas]|uniref:hypothetical protein n=1 Tax=unclassified Endozoicomonas TaxID=2644528 RepID=UPI00214802B9|nr:MULTISPECIES: hypothetical protein [unclassified Endozoicomonas]
MKQCIRLILVLVTMMLPCTGYSGDDRFDALLPLTALSLMQIFKTFTEGDSISSFFNLEGIQVWSFNRDHYSSDGWTDEQTVDGILTVSATFHQATPMDATADLQPRSSNFIDMGAGISAYFSYVLPLLTEYFRSQFNPDRVYYLDRANLERHQGTAVDDDPDGFDDDHDVSDDEGKASEKETGARAINKECEFFKCEYDDCSSVSDTPENWKAHVISDMKKGTITYQASLYYSGFLRPAFGPEPSPEQKDMYEKQCDRDEELCEDLITQTRRCIDLFNNGLDEGLSEYLPSDPNLPYQD